VRTNEFELGNHKHFWCIDGNKVVSRYDAKEVLDIKGSKPDNCAEVCAWVYKGSNNQHWQFQSV